MNAMKYEAQPIRITSFNFAKPVLKTLNRLQFPDRKLELAGSASKKVLSLFATDIDLFQILSNRDKCNFVKHVSSLARMLVPTKEPNRAMFIELKSGGKHYSRSQLAKPSKRLKDELDRNVEVEPFNKVDAIFFDGNSYQEITIVYQFETMQSSDRVEDSLIEDFHKYLKLGNKYKAGKRLYSIYNLKGLDAQHLKEYLSNPVLSTINSGIADLEAYIRVPSRVRQPVALQYLKQEMAKVLPQATVKRLAEHLDGKSPRLQLAIRLLKKQMRKLDTVNLI